MTIKGFDALFRPKAIALVIGPGAQGQIAAVLASNLFGSGFKGRLMAVHPDARRVEGHKAVHSVADLPEAAELGVVCAKHDSVPDIIEALAGKGARAAVVITDGFGAPHPHSADACAAIGNAAARCKVRLIGPNCLGVLVPSIGLNASFSHRMPRGGSLAFVAQSGAIVTSVIDWAGARGVGFSHLVSLGDLAGVGFGEMLDHLASDPATRGILLYIETLGDLPGSARRFMSAARAAARMKPVIVVKSGRHPTGARAVESHTGAMAGTDAVHDAAFARAGLLRVDGLEELFDAAAILALAKAPKGDRLAILSNGGGVAALAADELAEQGGRLAELSSETLDALDQVLPAGWSRANPVNVLGDADARRYTAALQVLEAERGADGILLLHCPTALSTPDDTATAVAAPASAARRPLLLTSWIGAEGVGNARRRFAEHGIPTYPTPEQAVRAFMYLARYRRNQRLLTETPPSVPEHFTPDLQRARDIVREAVASDGGWLTEVASKQVLSAYGISAVPTYPAETPEEAAARAAEIGGPVVVKLQSPDLLHKTAAGGIALDVVGPAAAAEQARAIRARVAAAYPKARLAGFSVQPMVRRPGAYELIIGIADDPQFGPVILAGHGGTQAETIDDKAIGLPPLNMHLARELLSRTRIHRLLQGSPAHPAVNLDALSLALVRVSQLICDIPEIREMDINPLLADQFGVIALDARIRAEPPAAGPTAEARDRPKGAEELAASVPSGEPEGTARLAIRPYPKTLEESIRLGDGRTLLLRPIRPEDEPSLREAFTKLTPEEVRLRFFAPMRVLDHVAAARFTQLDYDREMALILTDPGIPGQTEIYGVVSVTADPDNEQGEYAVLVRHDMAGMGLGILLMRRIIDYAAQRGMKEIIGDVLRDNRTMLKLCKVLGFTSHRDPDDLEIVKVRLRLDPPA
ncbi:MAG: bifunctional acetate--CoA ligase family protein/GNAT family N-acetyltransferase [Thiohalocapsa sp.]|nr:bifunctional acetate--CoA ligase family protein/GNAT family N-acetyltransferase [Thiohalocapsa sp.]